LDTKTDFYLSDGEIEHFYFKCIGCGPGFMLNEKQLD
jgi:hypothetical protein